MISDSIENYMVSGIIESGIREDGGLSCYLEIPYNFHLYFTLLMASIHIIFILKWNHLMNSKPIEATHKNIQIENQQISSALIEKIVGVSCILSLALTFYFKIITRKGLFIFNPCHITLLIETVLLFSTSTPFMRKLHTYWTAWLFGAYLALLVPHLEGISQFQVLLYYYQHLLIVPIGPILLSKRYGFLKPGLCNQMTGFSSILIYQLLVLVPLSRLSMVNLNFALCHSDADPFFAFGYLYFAAGIIHLNFASFMMRWLSYLLVNLWDTIFRNFQKSGNK